MPDPRDRYPLTGGPFPDLRFDHGLVADVAALLVARGFPAPSYGDRARLQAVLSRFVFGAGR